MEESILKHELISQQFTKDTFMVQTPYPTATILILYLYLIFVYLPNYMKHRPPFVLKTLILAYDAVQVVLNLYIIYQTVSRMIEQRVDYFCPLVNESLLRYALYYYHLKIFDMLETVFFALKKKNNQISFLHVYHHIMIFTLSYIGLSNFKAIGPAFVYIILNCTVHLVMYMYYFMSAYSPSKTLMSMKKFVTQIQLLQFILLLIHVLWPLFFGHCYLDSKFLLFLANSQCAMMIFLFGKFYIKTYVSKEIKK